MGIEIFYSGIFLGREIWGKISTQPHTLIMHAFCDSNSVRFWNRVGMTVMHV